jgi:hypothetical protein
MNWLLSIVTAVGVIITGCAQCNQQRITELHSSQISNLASKTVKVGKEAQANTEAQKELVQGIGALR